MDRNLPNYSSVIISNFFNEIIFAIHKLNPGIFEKFRHYEGKILEFRLSKPDISIQLFFRSDRPEFISDRRETPNTILRTQWENIPRLLVENQENVGYFIEGDSYFLEELVNTMKSMRHEIFESLIPFASEKSAIHLFEKINFLISIVNSIEETTVQATQETLSEYFTDKEKFNQSLIQLDHLKNRVERLDATIKHLQN